jgi:hypothetical protein
VAADSGRLRFLHVPNLVQSPPIEEILHEVNLAATGSPAATQVPCDALAVPPSPSALTLRARQI